MQRKGCWYGFITIPQSAALTAPFAQGSRKTRGNQRFIATTAAAVCRPCVREGGTRSVPEGLLVRIHYNPSVSKLTAPFTQGSRKCAAINRCYRNDCGGILPSLCKGRWRTKCAGRVVGTDSLQSLSQQADSSLYTREPENARQPAFYCHDCGGILPSLCKGRWRTKCAGRVVGENL